jgi:SAM-dependent methyltransferase
MIRPRALGRAAEHRAANAIREFARRRRHGPPDFGRTLGPATFADDGDVVTQILFDRLRAEDVLEVVTRSAQDAELSRMPPIGDDPPARRWLVLNYGTWLGIPGVIERTGLKPDQPPPDVHAMARGPLAAAGGLGEADLVVAALRSAGADLAQVDEALDFGCSSGRVVRALNAAFPEVRWRGCDPNSGAIGWASRHIPAVEFFVSPQEPPLPLDEGKLGLVYAVSIWSHFGPQLGLRWFAEMHRLIRPGGHLVFTTHGHQSVAFYVVRGDRSAAQGREIIESLDRHGYWYASEFGQAGDAGIINPQWGTAFLSTEWVLSRLCPRWRVLEYAAGRNQNNQDVYVLQRV